MLCRLNYSSCVYMCVFSLWLHTKTIWSGIQAVPGQTANLGVNTTFLQTT